MSQLQRSSPGGVIRAERDRSKTQDDLGPQFDFRGEAQAPTKAEHGEEAGACTQHPGSEFQSSAHFSVRSNPRGLLCEDGPGTGDHHKEEKERSCHWVAGSGPEAAAEVGGAMPIGSRRECRERLPAVQRVRTRIARIEVGGNPLPAVI